MQEATAPSTATPKVQPGSRRKTGELRKRLWRNKWLYVMLLPGVLYFIIFKYLPMYGLIISFQNYKPYNGIMGSEWVGMEHFKRLFTEPDFANILMNTIALFALNLFIYFPVPIILALMLNELRGNFSNGCFRRSSICRTSCPGSSSFRLLMSW